MAETIVDDLLDWWNFKKDEARVGYTKKDDLELALRVLNVISSEEMLESYEIEAEWFQESEEFFKSVCSFEITGKDKSRTLYVAAYAVITPPPLSIIDRIEGWRDNIMKLNDLGVQTPTWLLIWRGSIFTQHPPFLFSEYLENRDLDEVTLQDLAYSLKKSLQALARYSPVLLSLLSYLRTDGLSVYYCGFGFDLGGVTVTDFENNLSKLEGEVLLSAPAKFREKYYLLQ